MSLFLAWLTAFLIYNDEGKKKGVLSHRESIAGRENERGRKNCKFFPLSQVFISIYNQYIIYIWDYGIRNVKFQGVVEKSYLLGIAVYGGNLLGFELIADWIFPYQCMHGVCIDFGFHKERHLDKWIVFILASFILLIYCLNFG